MPKASKFRRRTLVSAALRRRSAVATVALTREQWASLAGFMVPPALIALYLVKSALGINLFAGPSPLHELFYHWVR